MPYVVDMMWGSSCAYMRPKHARMHMARLWPQTDTCFQAVLGVKAAAKCFEPMFNQA